ncbi:Bifunctional glutamine synthetase adenylyltransferase/adenylyl-removing enzyme [BD1-7 clade bacterium]|uniref:Bifunctional glutamine synthetase adenylyltransferase/adenylyl-removing enzyme n=2 Tax=BD1-7 clade bacterium TaxID=2029982 RepID=A0A5S9QSC1_9GAMM|nr:Bifunctional glutamine synthetase adenylyltransferase/adenylyl-removing enzyme [BD1-7 clade bacterium]CAA0122189.1 Bifunctional glutamine synthetase adenylyltransferase/adenylyl-removing enzyme [BD1-7 clade bacterium]
MTELATIEQTLEDAFPDALKPRISKAWQAIFEAATDEQACQLSEQLIDKARLTRLNRCLAVSDYLARQWARKPQILLDVLVSDTLDHPMSKEAFSALFAGLPDDEIGFDQALRETRHRQMSRFIYRDLNRLCDTWMLVEELSVFADVCIHETVEFHYHKLAQKHGVPIGESSGEPQHLVVLGMGKLGAHELNLSSDIDLMFAFEESGTTNGDKPLANQMFFTRLGQRLIKSLDKVSIDGFVFRVDMRLRPYGQSGALAMNFAAMEIYYEDQGREWERYAMIKARDVVGGAAGASLMRDLRPFVYRRYTDFSAIQALRDMKSLITREVRRLGKQDDVKLGAGGIREIEFIAQAYQLIYGGRDEKLQTRSLRQVYQHLDTAGALPENASDELLAAYVFLRNAEHAIQALNDEQTQRLPNDEDGQLRIAYALGYEDWAAFMAAYGVHRTRVREHFDHVVEEVDEETDEVQQAWADAWASDDVTQLRDELQAHGFDTHETNCLVELRENKTLAKLDDVARERVDKFAEQMLACLQAQTHRINAVELMVKLVESVLRRTTYLVLLNENPKALDRLITIASVSTWVMQQLIHHPVLLDELLTEKGLRHVPEPNELRESLRQHSLRINEDDLEDHMDMLRYFKLARQMNIVVAEATGELPLFKVSDYLSYVAEAILNYVLQLSWDFMVNKHGCPSVSGEPCMDTNFAVVAYGKLGGIELGHNSDLDLVFLYQGCDQGTTDGDKPVDSRQFFTRLGQRIIHMLSTRTQLGQLYEVDMRLRPSGGKGLLVSSLDAFERYQDNEAWTWEHQALVRGRIVAGSMAVGQGFKKIRKATLMRERSHEELACEVIKMRKKMHDNLAPTYARSPASEIFHLKHSRWGIVDIEFMVQYAVLAWSREHPELTRFTDNIRILELLADTGLITEFERRDVVAAYQAYRSYGHKLGLRQEKNEAPAADFLRHRQAVKALWCRLLGAGDDECRTNLDVAVE